jgi:hypothetical protein
MTPYEVEMEKKRRAMESAPIDPVIRRPAAAAGGGGIPAPDTRTAMLARSAAANPQTVPSTAPDYVPKIKSVTEARPLMVRDINPRTGIPYAGLNYRPGVDQGQVISTRDVITNPLPSAAAPRPAPVAAAPAAVPARDPRIQPFNQPASAVPAPVGRPVLPGQAAAANPQDIVGTFNGRNITKSESDKLAGSTNFGAAGAPAIAPVLARAPAAYQAPSVNLSGNLAGADTERKALISRLGEQLGNIGELNTRGKRDLAGQILGLQAGLTRAGFDQAGDLTRTGAQLNAQGADAALNANANADDNADARAAQATESALTRKFSFDNSGTNVRGANGDTYLQRGSTVAPVLGPDGKPFKAAPDKSDGAVTPEVIYKALSAERAAILANAVDPASAQSLLAAYDASPRGQQLAAMEGNQGQGAAAKTVVRTGTTADGRKVVQYSDGSTELAP